MKARKDNKVYDVDAVTKERYVKDGFDIYDDNDILIENGKNKTVAYEKYEELIKEITALKAEIVGTKDLKVADIKAILDEKGIDYAGKTKKEELMELLPSE